MFFNLLSPFFGDKFNTCFHIVKFLVLINHPIVNLPSTAPEQGKNLRFPMVMCARERKGSYTTGLFGNRTQKCRSWQSEMVSFSVQAWCPRGGLKGRSLLWLLELFTNRFINLHLFFNLLYFASKRVGMFEEY